MNHFQIELSSLLQSLRFYQFTRVRQLFETFTQFILDQVSCIEQSLPRCHVVRFWIDCQSRHFSFHFTCKRIKKAQALDFIIEQLDTNGLAF